MHFKCFMWICMRKLHAEYQIATDAHDWCQIVFSCNVPKFIPKYWTTKTLSQFFGWSVRTFAQYIFSAIWHREARHLAMRKHDENGILILYCTRFVPKVRGLPSKLTFLLSDCNEIRLQVISDAMRTRCFRYFRKTGSPSHNFSKGYVFCFCFSKM